MRIRRRTLHAVSRVNFRFMLDVKSRVARLETKDFIGILSEAS